MNIELKKEDLENLEILGTILSYPRWKKAEILFGDYSDENIAKIDLLQAKYFPTY